MLLSRILDVLKSAHKQSNKTNRAVLKVDDQWLSSIKMAHAQRQINQAATGQLLWKCFNSVANPYTTALYLYDNAMDRAAHSGKLKL